MNRNLLRLARRLGYDLDDVDQNDLDDIRATALDDPAAFWLTVVDDLNLPLGRPGGPIGRVLDNDRGMPWARWFPGAPANLARNCLERRRPSQVAIVEDSDGTVTEYTYSQLENAALSVAAQLHVCDATGQAVGVLLPPSFEAAAVFLGCWLAGATVVPLFTGFGDEAAAARLRHSRACVLYTRETVVRKGQRYDLGSRARRIANLCPTVAVTVRMEQPGWRIDGVHPYVAQTTADDDALLIYTSGTTGAPKGVTHSHGGFGVKVAAELAYQFDLQPEDRLLWCSDTGWIMFVWELVGVLSLGAAAVFSDGAYDDPTALAARTSATILGGTPGILRIAAGRDYAPSVRAIGASGEPFDDPDLWATVRAWAPIVNISGGTEVGTNILAHHLDVDTDEQQPGELGGPALGMDVTTRRLRGPASPSRVMLGDSTGIDTGLDELCVAYPWPGMTTGLYGDPRRFLDTYFPDGPDVWKHGDVARREHGSGRTRWYIPGRLDDQINVKGKRIACEEIEEAAASSINVSAALCRSGVDQIEVLVVRSRGATDESAVDGATRAIVDRLGRPFAPHSVHAVAALPRTESGKLTRRAWL